MDTAISAADVLDRVDLLASHCDESVEACKAFSAAARHFFLNQALFYSRYYQVLIRQVDFIEEDMARNPDMCEQHVDFKYLYGYSGRMFNDYRKLRDSEELRDIARRGELTSRSLRAWTATHAAPPELDQAVINVLAAIQASGLQSDELASNILKKERYGMAPPTEKGLVTLNADIKRNMKETMADALCDIQLTLCNKYNKAKASAFEDLVKVFKSSPVIILYHGTTVDSANKICTMGPDINFATGSTDDGANVQRVFLLTSNPAVADAWCRREVEVSPGDEKNFEKNFKDSKDRKESAIAAEDEKDMPQQLEEEKTSEELKTGQPKDDQPGRVTRRCMVAFKALLVGGSAAVKASGCTGNTWKYPSNALPLLKPIYKIEYNWGKPGVRSNKLRPTIPPGYEFRGQLEPAEGGALLRRWMLKHAVFARGVATPDYLAHIFGQ